MLAPLECLRLAGLSLALAVVLAEIYAGVAQWAGVDLWIAAAAVHTGLAATIVAVLLRRHQGALLRLRGASLTAQPWLASAPWRAYLPAAGVVAGTAILTIASRQLGHAPAQDSAGTRVAWVLWVPLVEELVFRAGIGQAFQRLAPGFWGIWFAALTFGLVHADPTVAHLISGHLGLPLGPFLLALACQSLVAASGRLAPAVALHAACNATVAIFAYGDARWLDWLGFLYS